MAGKVSMTVMLVGMHLLLATDCPFQPTYMIPDINNAWFVLTRSTFETETNQGVKAIFGIAGWANEKENPFL